jgi:pimeloyl-ACP methyl ester carboxylesterase
MEFEANGAMLHYETWGDGEPLLWLHGFMGAGPDWRYIFEQPPEGFRLIAPDLRGHGASDRSAPFSFRACADDIKVLLNHLGVEQTKAIGLSGGGITLLHLATSHPWTLASMVIVSAPPYFPARARAIQRQSSVAMLSAVDVDLMRKRHKGGDDQLEELLAIARGFAESYDDVSFTPPHLATITAETLIVFGDRDPLYPVSLAMELYEAIPRSHLWVVPNGGHGPVFGRQAAPFAEATLSFLKGEWQQTQ